MATDAIKLLEEDHEKVRDLLGQLLETNQRGVKKRQELLASIVRELEIHGRIEEEIFYPALREAGDEDDERACFEAVEMHRTVEKLAIPELAATAPDAPAFGSRVKVLKELVDRHVEEEEEEMFQRAQDLLSQVALGELGELMAERKQDLEAELG